MKFLGQGRCPKKSRRPRIRGGAAQLTVVDGVTVTVGVVFCVTVVVGVNVVNDGTVNTGVIVVNGVYEN